MASIRVLEEFLPCRTFWMYGKVCHGNQIPHMSHAHLKHCFRTILKPSAFHIGRGVALHAQAAVLVYINARHPQIAQMITHPSLIFSVTKSVLALVRLSPTPTMAISEMPTGESQGPMEA